MRSLMRHIADPGCRKDAVDDLDASMAPDICALIREYVNAAREIDRLRASRALMQRGLFLDRYPFRPGEATHALQTKAGVYLFNIPAANK